MIKRPCIEDGCPILTTRTRCTDHERHRDQQRGTRQDRGYDAAHDQHRRNWEPRVATGTVRCWRCHKLIRPIEPWDLGHDDHDRTITRGPEHANQCNRAEAGRRTPRPPR